MSEPDAWPRRRFYGIAEIAEAVGVDRQLVTVWRRRSSHGLPPPDEELASGPLWAATSIEAWIHVTRSRLRAEATGQRGVRLTESLAKQAASRLFHLTALLLEEPRRADAIAPAARALGMLHGTLADAVGTAEGSKRGLQDIVAVSRTAGRIAERITGHGTGHAAGRTADRAGHPIGDQPSGGQPSGGQPSARPSPAADRVSPIAGHEMLDDLLAVCLRTASQVPKLLARAERE
jgi:hypothetical protein